MKQKVVTEINFLFTKKVNYKIKLVIERNRNRNSCSHALTLFAPFVIFEIFRRRLLRERCDQCNRIHPTCKFRIDTGEYLCADCSIWSSVALMMYSKATNTNVKGVSEYFRREVDRVKTENKDCIARQ